MTIYFACRASLIPGFACVDCKTGDRVCPIAMLMDPCRKPLPMLRRGLDLKLNP